MEHCHISFKIASNESLTALSHVFYAIKKAKDEGTLQVSPDWQAYFTEAQLMRFWAPSPEEMAAWQKAWLSTPVPIRFNDQSLQTPWDFDSMIDAIQNGEYSLVGIREITEGQARLEFDPEAYPFGGTESLQALIEAFGHEIIGVDDGTGYSEASTRNRPGWPARWAEISESQ